MIDVQNDKTKFRARAEIVWLYHDFYIGARSFEQESLNLKRKRESNNKFKFTLEIGLS